jgi:arginase
MKKIRIIGTPMDLGQNRRGVDMGPSAIRYAGLKDRLQQLGYETVDGGNINTAQAEELDTPAEIHDNGKAHHLHEVARVCQKIYERVQATRQTDERLIFLGGDHSMSIGTISAIAHEKVGVIWFDAHADINTPDTSPSGNIHGMPVATLLGDGAIELTSVGYPQAKLQPHQIVLVGVRQLDEGERERLSQRDIKVFTMREVDEMGIGNIAHTILAYFQDMTALHLSLDLDGLDPQFAPGVGTPVPGGFSYREAHLFMEILADSGKVRSMDIVEVNPILDRANETARLAVELTTSVFGQKIL